MNFIIGLSERVTIGHFNGSLRDRNKSIMRPQRIVLGQCYSHRSKIIGRYYNILLCVHTRICSLRLLRARIQVIKQRHGTDYTQSNTNIKTSGWRLRDFTPGIDDSFRNNDAAVLLSTSVLLCLVYWNVIGQPKELGSIYNHPVTQVFEPRTPT
jgi:hypothetical protein